MSFIEKLRQIERVDCLIRRKSTGSPKDLSIKMGISERQIYNIINDMKDLGAPIFFCKFSQSYCYEDKGTIFRFGCSSEENTSLNDARGGGNNITNRYTLLKNLVQHTNFDSYVFQNTLM